MQLTRKRIPAALTVGVFLAFWAFSVFGAETGTGSVPAKFSLNQRLPLPEKVEVTGIASADRSLWFVGLDRSGEVPVPAVYSWSFEGIRQFRMPGEGTTRLQTPALAVSRNGEALLLQSGQLWAATEETFAALPALSKSPVVQVAGREGFWALTADGTLFYMASVAAAAKQIARIEGGVTAMSVSPSGDLWYAPANGRLTLAKRDGSSPDTLAKASESAVTALYADANEQLWAAFADGKVARYVGGSVDWFSSDEGLPGGAASQIVEDGYGNLVFSFGGSDAETSWIVTQPRNLRTNLRVQFRRFALDGLTGGVRTVAVDHLGGMWVSVGTEGAFRLQGLADMNWPRGAALSRNDGQNGDVNRATALAGALAKATGQKPSVAVPSFPVMPGGRLTVLNTTKGLPNDNVSCVVADGLKNVYFTTGYTGFGPDNDQDTAAGGSVIKYDHRVFTTLAVPTASSYQACAWDTTTGTAWFGGTNGVYKYNPTTNTGTSYLSGQNVVEIIVRGADIYAATRTGGVFKLTAATGAQTANYTLPVAGRISSIGFDQGGTLYVGAGSPGDGTWDNGVYKLVGSSLVAETQVIKVPTVGNNSWVHDIEFDNSNNLWVVQRYGSIWRRSGGGTWTEFKIGPNQNGVYYRSYRIYKDTGGNLWFSYYNFGAVFNTAGSGGPGGTRGGAMFIPVAQVSASSITPVMYGTDAGLPVNSITTVAEEPGIANSYWFGSPGAGAWRVGGPFSQPGFPAQMTAYPDNNSPLLVDLDNDGKLDIVAADTKGKIYAFKSDGTTLWTVDLSVAVPALGQQVRSGVLLGSPFGVPAIDSSAAAGDVDGDGEIEIVIGVGARAPCSGLAPGVPCVLGQGGVVIVSRTGQVKRFLYTQDILGLQGTGNSTRQDGFTESVFATPVLANVDGDPELEIVAGAFDNLIYAWNGDGSSIYSVDNDNDGRYDEDFLGDSTPYTPFDSTDDAPGIKNVDDNGDGVVDNSENTDDDEDGLPDEDYPEWPAMARDTTFASAAIWDLNGDGSKEIIVAHDYSNGVNQEFNRGGVLRVLNPQGQQVSGFPKGNLEQVIWSSPVVVDLDNDGQYEIIHGTGLDMGDVVNTPAGLSIGQLVYAWKSNGDPFKAGNSDGKLANVEGRSFASFAVGDLDNDGSPELVILTAAMIDRNNVWLKADGTPASNPSTETGGQKLYVFDVNGNVKPGWPVRPLPLFANAVAESSPILADVDGDGFLDIIVGVRKGPLVFDRNGHILPGMGPFEALEDDAGTRSIRSTAAYADIDNDGIGELVWTTANSDETTGSVRVVKLGAMTASYNKSWPQWRRTVNRNGVFGPIISLVQSSVSGNTLTVRVQAFGGRASLAAAVVNLSAIGGSSGQPLAVAPNSYYTATQSISNVPVGRYELPVTIVDAAGKSDTQTLIYFKRGSGKSLSLSTTGLNFGTTTQGAGSDKTLTMTNIGDTAVTVTSITSNSAEFVANVQNTPIQALTSSGMSSTINGVPFGFTWVGPLMPKQIAPGESFTVHVRFRPNNNLGSRVATLTINSDDAAGPRTVALSASTGNNGASPGCAASLPTASSSFTNSGSTRNFKVTIAAGCAWTAQQDVNWLSAYADAATSTIYMTVYPNLTVQPRVGKINVNGTILLIYQNGSTNLTEVQRFVSLMYFTFFGRYPSDAEREFQINGLGLGSNPTAAQKRQLALNFLVSNEFNEQGRFAAGLYVGILNRDLEYTGWVYQRNAIATGQVGQFGLVWNFLKSPEFNLKNPNQTRAQLVTMLYNQVLLRTPSQEEVDFQANRGIGDLVAGGKSEDDARAQVAQNFLRSEEFRIGTGPRLFAVLLYALFLQRDPTPAEFNAFRDVIQAAPNRDAALADLILQQLQKYEAKRLIL